MFLFLNVQTCINQHLLLRLAVVLQTAITHQKVRNGAGCVMSEDSFSSLWLGTFCGQYRSAKWRSCVRTCGNKTAMHLKQERKGKTKPGNKVHSSSGGRPFTDLGPYYLLGNFLRATRWWWVGLEAMVIPAMEEAPSEFMETHSNQAKTTQEINKQILRGLKTSNFWAC